MRISTKIVSGLTLIATAGLVLAQTYPQWWLDQNVVSSQPPAAPSAAYDEWMADNYAAANLGQAKNLAEQAMDAMNAAQAGSAGSAIASTVARFSTLPEDNYVPLTIGQLKALVAPFYDVMHAASFTVTLGDGTVLPIGSYPWTTDVTPDNLAVANLGQLKHVFSFDLGDWCITWDEVPEAWKQAIVDSDNAEFYDPNGLVTSTADVLPGDDYDGDGYTNREEYLNNTDPTDFYNGQTAEYTINILNTQLPRGATGAIASPSLVFEARNASGNLVPNAPIFLDPSSTGTSLTSNADGSSASSSLVVLTDGEGKAIIYIKP